MITTILAVLAAQAVAVTPIAAPAAPVERRYCAENVAVDGGPYVKDVCHTRSVWIKRYGVDPLQVAATVKQRPLRTRVR